MSETKYCVWVTSATASALTPTAIALGNFDGVHRGHQQVIQPILQTTSQGSDYRGGVSPPHHRGDKQTTSASVNLAGERVYATVVTFNPHPQEFFSGQSRALLTPRDEKVQQLRQLGVEQLVLLPFDRELAALTPQEFVEEILVKQLRCQQISVGQDFRFGAKRSGTAQDLKYLAGKYNIPVHIVPLQTLDDRIGLENLGIRISSSLIRQSLETGDIPKVTQLLGRPYTLVGTVVTGQQLGRTIGFPTANLQLPPEKFLPCQGVYAVRVRSIDDGQTPTVCCDGVMNIGDRPTVDGRKRTVEVHLLNWSQDLYGRTLAVQLVKFLRPEQKFPSLDALKTQIHQDSITAEQVLSAES